MSSTPKEKKPDEKVAVEEAPPIVDDSPEALVEAASSIPEDKIEKVELHPQAQARMKDLARSLAGINKELDILVCSEAMTLLSLSGIPADEYVPQDRREEFGKEVKRFLTTAAGVDLGKGVWRPHDTHNLGALQRKWMCACGLRLFLIAVEKHGSAQG